MTDLIAAGIIIVGAAIVIVGGAYWFSAARCAHQAHAMGVSHTYGAFQGCIIKAPNGQWVPLENFRVL